MNILYVTTVSDTLGFFTEHINTHIEEGYNVDIATNITKTIDNSITTKGCQLHNVPFNRNPFSFGNVKAYLELKQVINSGKYQIIHTHTPVASAITRAVCKNRNIKIIYTAHGFHFYKGASFINWLIYYPVEKYLSKFTNVLITINTEDYNRSKNKLNAAINAYLPGVGFDYEKFSNSNFDKIEVRKELEIPQDALIIISVGELNKNKNHEVIIKAISRLKNKNIHYMICGEGILKEYLIKLSVHLGISDNVHLLGFRKDIDKMYNCADIFAFPSKREGLGLAALEAMASGLPIVTSNVHGINDYSVWNQTGFCYHPKDIKGFAEGIDMLVNNKDLRDKFGNYNKIAVKKFDISNVLQELRKIYLNL